MSRARSKLFDLFIKSGFGKDSPSNEQNDVKMKDVFISHSTGDKPVIEPLVSALESSGITCWYDLLELSPGDSLVDKINEGLTHCKIVLFCLSNNFLEGNWTVKELKAAVGLATLEKDIVQLVPLMITEPSVIQQAYPIPFGDMVYIRWDEKNIDDIVTKIKMLVSEVDSIGKDYWYREAVKSYNDSNFARAVLYAHKAVQVSPKDYPICVHYVASLLKLAKLKDAYRFIMDKEFDWELIEEGNVNVDILDYVQDTITSKVEGNEFDKVGFAASIIDFLATKSNAKRAWKYFVRLYDKPEFKYHQDKVVLYAALQGKANAIDWLRNNPLKSSGQKVRERLADILYSMAVKLPNERDNIISMASQLIRDDHEDVRMNALPTYYYFAADGPAKIVEALNDRAPMVRLIAFLLLAGLHNIEVDDEWNTKEGEPLKPSTLFQPEIVKRMLNDPDENVFEAIMELIADGKISCPVDVDIMNIQRPPSEQARQALVKRLSQKDSDANFERLKEMALNDVGEFVRSDAIEKLQENPRPISASYLRKLFQSETVSSVKDDVESLILEKGDANLLDIYYQTLEKRIDSLYSAEKAFEKLVDSGDIPLVSNAIELCSKKEKLEIPGSQLKGLLAIGLTEQAQSVVEWCLDNKKEESLAILAAGLLPSIDLERITAYYQHENPILYADALRATERRLGNGKNVSALRNLYEQLKQKVLEKDNNSIWACLEIIDGILEFEGRTRAISMLKEYYDLVDRLVEGGSFPLRAAWERLRILGETIPHPVYEKSDDASPYPWPNRKGPFYGIFEE